MEPARLEGIETPALIVDMDALESNIRTMAEYMKGRKARLRPHFKTHKCPTISHMQLAAGAKGVTCAKLSEAEVLLASGIRDVLIANQVVDPAKIARLAGLSRGGARIGVCVDDPRNVDALSDAASRAGSTLNVLIEVDVGMRRCGVPGGVEALALAQRISRLPGLRFGGIQAYEGHVVQRPDIAERRAAVTAMVEKVGGIKALLEDRGFPVADISGGATGTYDLTGNDTIWTEIQAGSYVFMDSSYGALGLPFRQALSVLVTVIHKRPGWAVTDTGMKACATDHGMPTLMGRPHLKVRTNEEHGIVEDTADELRYGEKVGYLPGHCCTTVNLYDRYYCVRAGSLEAIWPISGRGRSQ
jgi:D-serine deaminase-like pyridoxal phosphate-dependent protein